MHKCCKCKTEGHLFSLTIPPTSERQPLLEGIMGYEQNYMNLSVAGFYFPLHSLSSEEDHVMESFSS